MLANPATCRPHKYPFPRTVLTSDKIHFILCYMNIRKSFLNALNCLSVVFLLAASVSCSKMGAVANLKSETLFTLDYGKFENELDLYEMDKGSDFSSKILMRDGFFYLSDNNSKKIMQLNSYGDLLSIIYNPKYNPVPSFIQFSDIAIEPDGKPSVNATQRSTVYSFINPGNIALDSDKNLYIVDFLPEDRFEMNANGSQMLRQVVLRFSADGTYLDYLGQQGPGGTPFPFIKNIYTTKNNELVVVCITSDGYMVYWFSEEGFQKYVVPIYNSRLPECDENYDSQVYAFLDEIIPDYKGTKLYLKIDYSIEVFDDSSKVQSGIVYKKTLLYPLDMKTGQYETPLNVPPYEQVVKNELSRVYYDIPYDFLGITESGWFFFMIAEGDGYTISMIQPNGQKIIRRHISLPDEELVYYNLSFSPNGIVSAMVSTPQKTYVMWWRTDAIIQSLLPHESLLMKFRNEAHNVHTEVSSEKIIKKLAPKELIPLYE